MRWLHSTSYAPSGMNKDSMVLDTNLLILFLAGNETAVSAFRRSDIHMSVINEMELLCNQAVAPNEEASIRSFLAACTIWNIDLAIKEMAIGLRKRTGIKLPDAIVVATAVVLGLPLLSADKDFARLPTDMVHFILFEP
jgi:predicted nucleic acid-binding protein